MSSIWKSWLSRESSPQKYAFWFALIYFVISNIWIFSSTHLARILSLKIHQTEMIETWKDFFWTSGTSILLFVLSFYMFRRVAQATSRILRSQQELANSERHAFAGMIAASVAHDFNNILMILRVSADRLLQETGLSERGRTNARKIDDNLQRLADLSQRLRNVSKLRVRTTPASFDLVQTIRETISLVSLHEKVEHCALRFHAEPDMIQIEGFPILIHQMVMNLMLNAADATGGHGVIEISLIESANKVVLRVDDNGPGVPEDIKAEIFEAFYTTKKSGSGLGLVSVQDCISAHRGIIRLDPSALGGASFVIEFPHAHINP